MGATTTLCVPQAAAGEEWRHEHASAGRSNHFLVTRVQVCEVWVAVIRIGQPTQQVRFHVHVIASNTAVTGAPGCGAYREADLHGRSGRRCGAVRRQRGLEHAPILRGRDEGAGASPGSHPVPACAASGGGAGGGGGNRGSTQHRVRVAYGTPLGAL